MELNYDVIVNSEGKKKAVIIDYEIFKKIEEELLDKGLAKAMEEVENEASIDLSTAKKISDDYGI